MDSKVATQDTGLRVQIDRSRVREAPKTDFGSKINEGIARTAGAVMDAGSIAAPFIPGGAMLSAAISGVGQLKSAAGGAATAGSTGYGANATALTLSSGVSATGGGAGGLTAGAGGASSGNPFTDMRAYQAEQMSLNMQYLQLQQDMQQENRQFTTLSNVMKTKHDTAKNAINNVR